MKNYLKYVEKDDFEIKKQCVKGMSIFIKKSFSYSMLNDYFD